MAAHTWSDDSEDPEPSAADQARLDAALADYRDRTYATWTAPPAHSELTEFTDKRVLDALRAEPAPRSRRPRLRAGLTAACAAGVLAVAVTVALSMLDRPGATEPRSDVLLAAAAPGGDRGPFDEQSALERCLDVAGVPEGQRIVIGAGPVSVRGASAVALLLGGAGLGELRVLAVTPACATGDQGSVLADRTLSARRTAATLTSSPVTP